MQYHPLTQQIIALLNKNRCWHETFEHAPVLTSEEAVKTRPGYTLKQGAKALIVKVEKRNKEESFIMLVIPANLRLDSKKVKKALDLKSFRFATEEEISDLMPGLVRGAVPPFGNLFGLEVIVDKKLLENEKMIFNAGDRRFSVAMKTQDYQKMIQPMVIEIVS